MGWIESIGIRFKSISIGIVSSSSMSMCLSLGFTFTVSTTTGGGVSTITSSSATVSLSCLPCSKNRSQKENGGTDFHDSASTRIVDANHDVFDGDGYPNNAGNSEPKEKAFHYHHNHNSNGDCHAQIGIRQTPRMFVIAFLSHLKRLEGLHFSCENCF